VGQRRLGKLDAAQRDNLVKGVLAGKDVKASTTKYIETLVILISQILLELFT